MRWRTNGSLLYSSTTRARGPASSWACGCAWRADRPAIGAAATVFLPDGRRMTAQVDGGNGHSGKRSQDLHFGLGNVPR